MPDITINESAKITHFKIEKSALTCNFGQSGRIRIQVEGAMISDTKPTVVDFWDKKSNIKIYFKALANQFPSVQELSNYIDTNIDFIGATTIYAQDLNLGAGDKMTENELVELHKLIENTVGQKITY